MGTVSTPPRDAPSWFVRYRPYLVLVLVVSLAVLPSRVRHETKLTTAGTGGTGATAPAVGDAGEVAGAQPPVTDSGGTVAAAPGAAPGATAQPAATGATAVAPVDRRQYPGVGSPAALANPECDRKTGRIRFPSIFAPECVAPWPAGADNGGSTAVGVTKDAVNLVIWVPPRDASSAAGQAATQTSPEQARAQVLETIGVFADNYELWGRKLAIQFVQASGTDEAAQRADAVAAYNKYKPFMSTTFLAFGGVTPLTFSTEMAARGVITWDEYVPFAAAHAQPGLRWSYNPDDRLSALSLGEYVGKRLVGRPAKWAGDPTMQPQKRSFGLIYDDAWDRGAFDATLARYGHGAVVTDAVSYHDSSDVTALANQALTQITRMRSKNINNIVVVAGPNYSGLLAKAATQQNYKPEWTISGWKVQDTAVTTRLYTDSQQWAHAFGIGLVPPLEIPVSISERSQLIEWGTGHAPTSAAVNGIMYLFSKNAIAGLHLAGPNLTPATYRDALFRRKPTGGRYCGCKLHNGVSFGRQLASYPWDKYFDVDDFTEKWWDADEVGEDEVGLRAPGRYRVVDGGRRFTAGDWPTTDPDVFNPATSVMDYRTPPGPDQWPNYPRPKH
jgi:hypothetical protein